MSLNSGVSQPGTKLVFWCDKIRARPRLKKQGKNRQRLVPNPQMLLTSPTLIWFRLGRHSGSNYLFLPQHFKKVAGFYVIWHRFY
jgi:hypothetical protein